MGFFAAGTFRSWEVLKLGPYVLYLGCFEAGTFCLERFVGESFLLLTVDAILTRVFDETLFRIFAKHETHEISPVFREIFASFASFARSNFRNFRVS